MAISYFMQVPLPPTQNPPGKYAPSIFLRAVLWLYFKFFTLLAFYFICDIISLSWFLPQKIEKGDKNATWCPHKKISS